MARPPAARAGDAAFESDPGGSREAAQGPARHRVGLRVGSTPEGPVVAMLDIIAAALLPAIATVLIGYVAAWHHDLSPKDAQVLNRMVLTYALPLAIFVDTVGTPRDELIKDLPLLVVLTAGLAVVYGLVLLVWRLWLRAS